MQSRVELVTLALKAHLTSSVFPEIVLRQVDFKCRVVCLFVRRRRYRRAVVAENCLHQTFGRGNERASEE